MYQIWVSLAKQCFSMVWFPNSWFYLSRKKCIVAMFSYFKKREKNLPREVYLLARCFMLNWSRRQRLYMPLKHEIYGYFFYICSTVFAEKYMKNILQEMKNGLSLRQQQLQVIMYYIITWAFHKLTCRQNKCTPKKRTILLFIFNSKRYRDFS